MRRLTIVLLGHVVADGARLRGSSAYATRRVWGLQSLRLKKRLLLTLTQAFLSIFKPRAGRIRLGGTGIGVKVDPRD